MSDGELNLSIPLSSIYDEFICPICFNEITECVMPVCGHNFCKKCLLECLNRRHKCPCCNTSTTKEEIVVNRHFDKMLDIVKQEKEQATKRYFDRLVNTNASSSSTGPDGHANASGRRTVNSRAQGLTNLETIFQHFMEKCLLGYHVEYEKLQKHYRDCETVVRQEAAKKRARAVHKKKSQKQLDKIQSKCEVRVASLKRDFDESDRLMIEAYQRYLESVAPAPTKIPVYVTLEIECKNYSFKRFLLEPDATIASIHDELQRRVQGEGDSIETALGPANVLVLRRNRGGRIGNDDDVLLVDENKPIVDFDVPPNSSIVLRGEIKFSSDKPPECFTAGYVKGAGRSTDYYSCQTCGINWVCDECAKTCHASHRVVLYMPNHTPTWNCCYCVKNKKCTIKNSRNKGAV